VQVNASLLEALKTKSKPIYCLINEIKNNNKNKSGTTRKSKNSLLLAQAVS